MVVMVAVIVCPVDRVLLGGNWSVMAHLLLSRSALAAAAESYLKAPRINAALSTAINQLKEPHESPAGAGGR